jgi:hypothetical protein
MYSVLLRLVQECTRGVSSSCENIVRLGLLNNPKRRTSKRVRRPRPGEVLPAIPVEQRRAALQWVHYTCTLYLYIVVKSVSLWRVRERGKPPSLLWAWTLEQFFLFQPSTIRQPITTTTQQQQQHHHHHHHHHHQDRVLDLSCTYGVLSPYDPCCTLSAGPSPLGQQKNPS